MSRAVHLEMYRLDGDTISAGCRPCPLLRECGGYTRRSPAWSCMDRCATCDRKTCDQVCLKKPTDFARARLEVGGFGAHGVPALRQLPPDEPLPRYIPVFQHEVEFAVPLPWAAIPLKSLMRGGDRAYRPVADTGPDLRKTFGLSPNARVVLLGTGKDRPIETYWRWRRHRSTPDALAALDLQCGIAPNYSLFLEDTRPQHLFNRKRSLLCASEWSAAGLPAVPYLQAVARADWDYWTTFLREHSEVRYVAKEFQTGLANPQRGELNIQSLAKIQDAVRRPLHVVAIGGARFRRLLATHFERWTVLDSVPFMRAVKRRVAGRVGARIRWEPARGDDVPGLVYHNVRRYEEWLALA